MDRCRLLATMRKMAAANFCVQCGSRLAPKQLSTDSKVRDACTKCDYVHYRSPKIGVGCLVISDGQVVLVRRASDLAPGKWHFPCGLMEEGETTEGTARRETEEKTGLDVDLIGVHGIYTGTLPDGGQMVTICYRARQLAGVLRAGSEAAEVRKFSKEEIPWKDLAFESTQRALAAWVMEK